MLMIGTVLYGYCGGYFGRDSYSNKRIEAIGVDWVVVRTMDDSGFPEFVCGEGIHEELKEYTDPKHKI